MVTFSKRRAGLFKKARELSVLCGAEIAIVVLSRKEKVFTSGHPASIMSSIVSHGSQCEHDHEEGRNSNINCERDLFWWNKDVDKMGLEELQEFMGALEELKEMVKKKVDDEEVKNKSCHGG
ncbi:hypothetical protein DH2020_014107 [Rehmannia glutinosa]|uniref:MADS-box domain-containing protein n=1 Tax=Rehmannia glutinosa TaxID=99300 RepID=A0ABR0WVF4_REHGL